MKFIKLPVIEVSFSKEKLKSIFNQDKKDDLDNGIDYDWDAMGITPPNQEDSFDAEFIEAEDDDFIEKVRRIRIDLIEDYSTSTVKMKNKTVTIIGYAGQHCFTPMTADELDVFLQDENNYIKL